MYFATAYKPLSPSALYYSEPVGYFGESPPKSPDEKIESVISVKDIGTSVTEGSRFGTLLKSSQDAIRLGVGKMELALGMGGGNEPVGAENYGKDAREALREVAKANQVEFVSIHAPTQIGNMSGFNPQERGFSDEYRKTQVDEVKKAIRFAADVAQGGAVVVHTGEFNRDMTDMGWNKPVTDEAKKYAEQAAKEGVPWKEFMAYDEEPGRQVTYLVDERTGKLIQDVRKSLVVYEPEFITEEDPAEGNRKRWIKADYDPDKDKSKFVDENNVDDLMRRKADWDPKRKTFKTKRMEWKDYVQRAEEYERWKEKDKPSLTPAEMFFRSRLHTQILQARGGSLYHGKFYEDMYGSLQEINKALEIAKASEKDMTPEKRLSLLEPVQKIKTHSSMAQHAQKFAEMDYKTPYEILVQAKKDVELELRYIYEASSAADAQAKEAEQTIRNVVTTEKYAKEQTAKSYAEAAIYAMEESNRPEMKKPIFVAPENIFPEMGYGSHPEELIEMVKQARTKMIEFLTADKIKSPYGQRYGEDKDVPPEKVGQLMEINNPYKRNMTVEQAKKEADEHIKATFDTQHLGMWWKHFQAVEGETVDARKQRFNKWYEKMVDRMHEEKIIGHIHLVDAMGAGHHHLPAGQGDLPVKEAVEYLRKKGYKGTIVSEGHGENANFGAARQLTETWKAFGAPIRSTNYSMASPTPRWNDVGNYFFGIAQNPYFIFGSYAPSNDWRLWSDVPIE